MWYKLDENRNSVPITSEEFLTTNILEKDRHVEDDTLPDGTRISTIFLGLNHNHGGLGSPILFETMVFSDNGDYNDYQERYCTWEEAETGHKRILEAVKEGRNLNERKTIKLNLKQNKDE